MNYICTVFEKNHKMKTLTVNIVIPKNMKGKHYTAQDLKNK